MTEPKQIRADVFSRTGVTLRSNPGPQESEAFEFLLNRLEQQQSAIEAALDLHQEYRCYDECGHDHTEDDVNAGRAVDAPDAGIITCEDGFLYSVCRLCHTRGGDSDEYTDEGEWPCETVKALRGEGAAREKEQP